MKTAIELISEERARQVSKEGYSESHDDTHSDGELAVAAACYALAPETNWIQPSCWPFDAASWNPCPFDRQKELVKSGALIVAEIERLQRIQGKQTAV